VLVEQTTFEEVRAVWAQELWVGRKSPIESTSAMRWLGGIDMTLMDSPASFWAARASTESSSPIVGVLSGHYGGMIDTSRSYRTRGLWVHERFRSQGLARQLIQAATEQALRENCTMLWTFPRQAAMGAYEKLGFQRVGDWIGVNDPGAGEFGPNCYAFKTLT
jgi:GNAT superfamily N-acetyltransferase